MGRSGRRKARPKAAVLQAAPPEPQRPEAAQTSWLPAALVAIPLVLLVVAAFSSCLGNGFVDWDDEKNFLKNTSFRGLGWSQLVWDWTSFKVGVYQPLAWMILGAEYLVWDLQPWGYHLTSLVLYVINTVVLFVLTLALVARARPVHERAGSWVHALGAGLAVALFAVHPLRTEVVAWASCQPYLPCALFEMLAVLAYLRAFPEGQPPRRGWLVGAFFLFAAALLSKAVAVTLPVLLLILDVYPLRRLGGGPGRWFGPAVRRVWWEKIPFAGLSLMFMGLAVIGRVKDQSFAPIDSLGISSRGVQACYGICFYLTRTIVPLHLMACYQLPRRIDPSEPVYLLSLLGAVALTVAVVLLRKRWPGLLAVWLSYLIILAPNLGILRIGEQIAADRYSYIALFGGVALLAAVLCRIVQSLRRSPPGAAGLATASLGVLLGLILLSRTQCQTWRNSEALWTNVLNHAGSDGVAMAHFHLGHNLVQAGRFVEAAVELEKSLQINPNYPYPHNDMGFVLLQRGHLKEAAEHFAEAIRINPNLASPHANLGAVLIQQKRFKDAAAHLFESVRIDPTDAGVRSNLGMALSHQGKLEEAWSQYAAAVNLNPTDAGLRNNVGTALFRHGRLDEARAQYAEALRLDPNHAAARKNMELVLHAQQAKHAAPPSVREK